MTISHGYSAQPHHLRTVAPAPAREILRANTESLATDTVSTVGILGGAEREAQVAELRQRYESGDYQIDESAVSEKLITAHIQS